MATTEKYVKLAQTLPPTLLRFFARYPPPLRSRSSSNVSTAPASSPLSISSSDSSAAHNEISVQLPEAPSKPSNPFQSQKHPVTGKWHEPIYSLRRQADLVKLARANGVEELLPFTVKGTQERIRKRAEHGLRVKGTGVGQRVKGKEWERTMKGRLDRRKQAMLEMPSMIQKWKQVSSCIHSMSLRVDLNCHSADGTRPGVEEMAKMMNMHNSVFLLMGRSGVVKNNTRGHNDLGAHISEKV